MSSFFTTLTKIGSAVQQSNRRRRRGCWLRAIGCLAFFGLLVVLATLFLFGLIRMAGAAETVPQREELAVQLVIDNSNSLFDKGGVGSDPELLRLAAARLFIEYLGVDDNRFRPSCGIIYFGSDARQIAPLTPLADTARRSTLVELLTEPERLGWTDQLGALELAREGLSGATGGKAIILLTDGKPEWSEVPTADEQTAYQERMADLGRQLGAAGIDLFIILLAGPLTDADAEIETVWQPMWQAMAAATPEGRFLVAREAADLPATYHNIVVALTGRQSDGVVVDATVAPEGLRETVPVEAGLARMMLVVRKSHPHTDVTIRRPGGAVLQASTAADGPVRRSGGLLEEIWTIERPEPGEWLVTASGEGRLTVWKDFEVAPPTPVPPATEPPVTVTRAATATVQPTETPAPTATTAALVVVPTAAPAAPVTPEEPAGSRWPILGAIILLAGGAGGYIALRRRGRRPVVSGTLHVLDGSETARNHTAFDLYALGKTAVTIGAGEADIRLPALPTPLVLRVQPGAAGEAEIVIGAHPDLLHNGRRLLTDQPVYDGDVFTIGQARLRYENLQRRRPRNRPTANRSAGSAKSSVSA